MYIISFNATKPHVGGAIVMPILQMVRLGLSITQLGRGGAGTDTQICLTLVTATITWLPVLFLQVPRLWPLLQPGGVSQQAPGPRGHSPGGCADEAGGGGWATSGGGVSPSPSEALGAVRRTLSWRWCHFLLQHSQGSSCFGKGGTEQPGRGNGVGGDGLEH